MKKIYSIVLMATALLIGTNAWAATFSGNTAAQLQDAIYAIMSGATSDPVITLSQNVDLDRTIWVGTENENDAFKSVTIDLNGHNISMNGVRDAKTNNRVVYIMFSLTHGELKIINNSANEAKVQLTGETADNSRIVEVFGTYRSSRWNENGTELQADSINTRVKGWFSHLEIGQNVLLYAAPGCLAEGIAVGVQGTRTYYKDASTQVTTKYRSDLFTNTWGFAQGVRVDYKGKMDIQGAADGKVYGFSTKGLLRSALSCSADKEKGAEVLRTPYINTYAENYYSKNGEVAATNGVTHKLDTLDAPFIYIHPESEIKVRKDGNKVAAIYAAGYAKWLVEGYAEGKTGMYVSSGTIDLEDAYVKSTANEWTNPEGIGSANGGGSGVVLNSRDSYSGDMDFVVSGDTKIESVKGYAIEEAVNTTTVVPNPKADPDNENYDEDAPETIPASNVSNITINGGTIEGGDKGAIIISGPTSDATVATNPEAKSTVVVYGGNVEGTTVVGATGDLDEITATGTHTTEVKVTDPTTGQEKTVVVVSKGGPLDEGDPTTGNMVSNQADSASIKWTVNTEDAIQTGKHLILKELEINTNDLVQTLTIENGATLEVGRVVLGSDARIIVEAGAKFIVYGTQGIVAPSVDNIVLQASQDAQATFLFHPDVESNRHPNATVEFVSKSCYRYPAQANILQRFGLPMTKDGLQSITASGDHETRFYAFDYASNAWKGLGYINPSPGYESQALDIKDLNNPFEYYQLLDFVATTPETGATYTMKGQLLGNDEPAMNVLENSWVGFANSYMAPIDGKTLLSLIPTTVDRTFYLNKISENQATWEANTQMNLDLGQLDDIKPMQPFLIRNTLAAANVVMDYEHAVYNPALGIANSAPARYKAMPYSATAKIAIQGQDGSDRILIAEGEQFSAEFDNGYDAVKYMNDGINMYVSADEKMSNFATDNLEDTYIGFQSVKGGEYTIDFTNVQGEGMTLVDLETGARTLMVEGNTYTFNADANTTNDYRFKIVNTANAMTAIENTEAIKSAKGVYTITGMYVGEMNVWNTLPAGVYVVNGEKRVK